MSDPNDDLEDLVDRVDQLVEDDGDEPTKTDGGDGRPRQGPAEPVSEPVPNGRRTAEEAHRDHREESHRENEHEEQLRQEHEEQLRQAAQEAEDEPDEDDEDAEEDPRFPRANAAATRLGNFLALFLIMPGHVIKVSLRQTIVATTRVMPFVGKSFWKGMIEWSFDQYQEASSADAVNLSHEPGGLEIRGVNWQDSDPDDPKQKPGWTQIGGDKTWGPGADGQNAVERLGKADVIFSDRSAHELSSALQARWAEALDMQQCRALIAGATVEQPIFEVYDGPAPDADDAGDGAGRAVADGGTEPNSVKRGQTTVHASEAYLDDVLVDLSSDFGDGKGMVFSGRKYKDQKLSEADAEQMDKAEIRGELAGKQGNDDKAAFYFKWAVIAIVLIVFAFVGLPLLFGSGGAGVSLPF